MGVLYAYTEESKNNDNFLKAKQIFYNMYKIKLNKTSKICCEMNVFLDVFINHFPKIDRSFIRKIAIDVLYF